MPETSSAKEAKAAGAKAAAAIDEQVESAAAEAKEFMNQFDFPKGVREFAERSIETSRETYGKMRDAAQATAEALEKSTARATETAAAFNLKTVDFAEANIDAGFAHLRKLLKTRDAAEALEMQIDFARKQTDAFNAQAKELGEFAVKAAKDAGEPFTSHVAKSFEQFKTTFPI